jgi:Tol biopolymer transport system component
MNTLHRTLVTLLLIVCAAGAAAADQTGSRRTLKPDDLFRVQDLSDPQVSPDGLWVAYVVTTNDPNPDEARSAIWMVSWDGSQRLQLTNAADGTGKPRWSPDGRFLAFVVTPTGSELSQMMLLDRRGGEARELTSAGSDISDYAWSPDGKRLVLVMQQGDLEKSPKPIVISARHFKDDDDGYLDAGHLRHLYLFDIDAKRMDPLTTDPKFTEDLPAWSPDGAQIAFVRTIETGPDADGKTDIDVMDAHTGATAHTIVRPFAPNTQRLAWSPDGKLVAYLQGLAPKFNAYMQDQLCVVAPTGGAPRVLTGRLDRHIGNCARRR